MKINILYLATVSLTAIGIWYIINRIQNFIQSRTIKYSQSTIHRSVKFLLHPSFYDRPSRPSQSENHAEKNSVKVIFVDNKAYWVSNNVFYCANAANGDVDTATAEPVNTENMDKQDIDKLLFILDTLKNGNDNDSGSSGDKRL